MPVQWRLATRGAFQAHVAQMEGGYDLSIIGTDDVWRWLVRRGEDDLAEGVERTLTAAKVVAEDAARGLADDPESGAAC
jgi:hypothetical protein